RPVIDIGPDVGDADLPPAEVAIGPQIDERRTSGRDLGELEVGLWLWRRAGRIGDLVGRGVEIVAGQQVRGRAAGRRGNVGLVVEAAQRLSGVLLYMRGDDETRGPAGRGV